MTWSRVYVAGWLIILGILAAWELYAVLSGNSQDPPLTRVVCRYVPAWMTLSFIAWLFWHFAARYSNPEYLKMLRGGK